MDLGIDYNGGIGMNGLDGISMFVLAQLVHIHGSSLVVHLAWGNWDLIGSFVLWQAAWYVDWDLDRVEWI